MYEDGRLNSYFSGIQSPHRFMFLMILQTVLRGSLPGSFSRKPTTVVCESAYGTKIWYIEVLLHACLGLCGVRGSIVMFSLIE